VEITIKNWVKVGVMAVSFILVLRLVAKSVPQLQGLTSNV
jgi:hypothetical protein